MSMLHRSTSHLKLSQTVLRLIYANPKILLFPLLSGLIAIGLFAGLSHPFWEMEQRVMAEAQRHQPLHLNYWTYVFILLYFFLANWLLILSNSALIVTIAPYFKGEPVSLRTGFRALSQHLYPLFLWAVITSTIGIVIKAVEYWSDRWEGLGWVTSFLASMSWTIATYFVIPILVLENVNPFYAIKRSSHLIRKTWGHAVRVNLKLGLLNALLRILCFVPFLSMLFTGKTNFILIGAITTVALVFLQSLFTSSIQMTLRAALYEYATQGAVRHFDRATLECAFQKK